MRRFKSIYKILTVLLIISILCGCSSIISHNDAIGKQDGSTSGKEDLGNDPDGNLDPTEQYFKVNLMYKGRAYQIPEGSTVKAHWRAAGQYFEATFDNATGTAQQKGMDGDYSVTLSGLPSKVTYNPNAYTANNNNREITIELYDYIEAKRGGGTEYTCISVEKLAVYRTKLTGNAHTVFYQFTPSQSGTYCIESWVSTDENRINPKLDVWPGTAGNKYYLETLDDGGTSSTYTKNFKYILEIDQEFIGNVYTFAIHADVDEGQEYPVNVDFAVQLNGGFSENWAASKLIIPQEKMETIEIPTGHKLVNPEIPVEGSSRDKFDGSLFGLNPDDGYYHKYNEETGKYDGELLFAYISAASRFNDLSFTHIEDPGNKALTVSNGTENYRYFICGNTKSSNYFCAYYNAEYLEVCPCLKYDSATGFGDGCPGVCIEGCPSCHKNCTNVTKEEYDAMSANNFRGYGDYANSYGMCPVNQEIKDFLQKFSVSQRYFMDGNGWVETHPTYKIDALEDDQWLFACAYFAGFTNLPA